jgi:hypothetical protein
LKFISAPPSLLSTYRWLAVELARSAFLESTLIPSSSGSFDDRLFAAGVDSQFLFAHLMSPFAHSLRAAVYDHC